MRKPTAAACAALAMDLLDGERIPYVWGKEHLDHRGADCQGLIEGVVRKLGGTMSYRGSNDMFRNACTYVATLKQAKKEKRLVPGAVLFIVRKDSKAPDHYQDNLGNASHIGWYTAGRHEVVHASMGKGAVVSSTLKNGWTHVGWLKAVNYENTNEEDSMSNDSILTLGARNERVKYLQERLIRLDYDVGSRTGADGIFGKATKAAIEQFQRDHALPVTGIWSELDEKILASRFTSTTSQIQNSLPEKIRAIGQELILMADQLGR